MRIGGQRLWQFNGSFSYSVREETTIHEGRNEADEAATAAAAADNIDCYS